MKINIAGDFCITSPYVSKNLFNEEIVELFNNSDINVINLECPIKSEGNHDSITKTGPHISTSNNIFKLLKRLNIDLVTLANNHIMDLGEEGLESTIEGCKQHQIMTVGVGDNLKDAAKPVIITKNNTRIGIINFCENEWSIAKHDQKGANPLDIIDNVKQIQECRKLADFVIVIIHGGHEYYNLPSPRMVKQYRFFAENGADAIIGHHPHCISGYEIYNNVPIFYSLGNLIFTLPSKYEEWYNGLILQLEIHTGEPINWEIIPIRQTKNEFRLSLLSDKENNEILSEVEEYSKIISNDNDLLRNWSSFVDRKRKQTLNIFSPINILRGHYVRGIFKRLGFNQLLLRRRFLAPILNNVRCEALSDLSKEVLESRITNK